MSLTAETQVASAGNVQPQVARIFMPDHLPTAAEAQEAREEGMDRALNSALKQDPEWSAKAYAYLERFARENEAFISEDVSESSRSTDLPQPHTDRAWGSIYIRAAKNGLIVQDGSGRSRRRHGSICPRWRSLVFGMPTPTPSQP